MTTINVQAATSATNSYTYTVPVGAHARVHWIHVEYTSAAGVGNRQIVAEVLNASDVVVYHVSAGAVQAASLVRGYDFAQGIYREAAFTDGEIQVPFPVDMVVATGWKIRVRDSANISAADSIVASLQYRNVAQQE